MLHRVGEPALLARLEITDAEAGLRLVPRAVHEVLPVGRHGRTEGRAVEVCAILAAAGLPVEGHDLILRQPGVVLPRAEALRVPDVAIVLPERGAERADRVVAGEHGLRVADELRAAASVLVVHPELRHADRGRGLRDDDVVAVGRPFRRAIPTAFAARELLRLLGGDVDDPDVVAAVAVGGVDDALAVGAEARLRVERHAEGERHGVAAGDRYGVEIAKQVEDDGASVGRDVDGEP